MRLNYASNVSVPFGDSIYLNEVCDDGYSTNSKEVSVPFGDSIYLNQRHRMHSKINKKFPSPSGTLYI